MGKIVSIVEIFVSVIPNDLAVKSRAEIIKGWRISRKTTNGSAILLILFVINMITF